MLYWTGGRNHVPGFYPPGIGSSSLPGYHKGMVPPQMLPGMLNNSGDFVPIKVHKSIIINVYF